MKRTLLPLMVFVLLIFAACSAPQESPTQSSGESAAAAVPIHVEQTENAGEAIAEASTDAQEASAAVDESAGDALETEVVTEAAPQEESAPATEAETEVVAEPVDWLTVVGRTEEGLATLGNPNAAVTMIDYSDFM